MNETARVILSAEQVRQMAPVLGLTGTRALVAAVHPDGSGWALNIHALPGERRDAIRAACAGTLTLPRARRHARATNEPQTASALQSP